MGAAGFPAREWGICQPGLSGHCPASLAGSFGSKTKDLRAGAPTRSFMHVSYELVTTGSVDAPLDVEAPELDR